MSCNWVKKEYPEQAPDWCSIDFGADVHVRQSDIKSKLHLFQMLTALGIGEIEAGAPAESESDFSFLQALAEAALIPADVGIQARIGPDEAHIRKTLDALKGFKRVTIHLSGRTVRNERKSNRLSEQSASICDALSVLKKICVEKEKDEEYPCLRNISAEVTLEIDGYSELANIIGLADAICAQWLTPQKRGLILNFTEGSDHTPSHVFASCLEEIVNHFKNRKDLRIGIRPRREHTAFAALLAGASRVEGYVFGKQAAGINLPRFAGELASFGVEPKLRQTACSEMLSAYEALAHSALGTAENGATACVPELRYGITLPRDLHDEFLTAVNKYTGQAGMSLNSDEAMDFFEEKYLHPQTPFQYIDVSFVRQDTQTLATVTIETSDGRKMTSARGNGLLDAVSNAYMQFFDMHYRLETYEEYSLGAGSEARALSFVSIRHNAGVFWGAGINEDISRSSIAALSAAVGRLCTELNDAGDDTRRIDKILNYIKEHYRNVTLDELSGVFYLSKPYLSKYIKEKSGRTFGDNLKYVRLQKAKHLLKNGNMKIEQVAGAAGYQNVEHFNRMFKKEYGCTPVQFRESSK